MRRLPGLRAQVVRRARAQADVRAPPERRVLRDGFGLPERHGDGQAQEHAQERGRHFTTRSAGRGGVVASGAGSGGTALALAS